MEDTPSSLVLTSKSNRDEWLRRFFRYFDQNPRAGKLLRDWQGCGCDLREIACWIYHYIEGTDVPFRNRTERGKKFKKDMPAVIEALKRMSVTYTTIGMNEDAHRTKLEAAKISEQLGHSKEAFSTKRLGVANKWIYLVAVEGYVARCAGQGPTQGDLACLVKAGRFAAGQRETTYDAAELIGKGVSNFKKRNPLLKPLWT
jgi:hypothetical protein